MILRKINSQAFISTCYLCGLLANLKIGRAYNRNPATSRGVTVFCLKIASTHDLQSAAVVLKHAFVKCRSVTQRMGHFIRNQYRFLVYWGPVSVCLWCHTESGRHREWVELLLADSRRNHGWQTDLKLSAIVISLAQTCLAPLYMYERRNQVIHWEECLMFGTSALLFTWLVGPNASKIIRNFAVTWHMTCSMWHGKQ